MWVSWIRLNPEGLCSEWSVMVRPIMADGLPEIAIDCVMKSLKASPFGESGAEGQTIPSAHHFGHPLPSQLDRRNQREEIFEHDRAPRTTKQACSGPRQFLIEYGEKSVNISWRLCGQ
jgi:hypothetical protein